MDVLGELIIRPHLRSHEIESERAVIVEEIRSYLDDPGEHVHTLFDLAMFGDTPLGREIAGSEESVRALPEANLRAFWASAVSARQRRRLGRRRHLACRGRRPGQKAIRYRGGREPADLRSRSGSAGGRASDVRSARDDPGPALFGRPRPAKR
jgi:hypothetical protein